MITLYNHNILFKENKISVKLVKKNINLIAHQHRCSVQSLELTFVTDQELLKINKSFLKHNTLTDIITFQYNEDNNIIGEIIISKERIEENASKFKVSLQQEILRVMFHGVLHLVGYKDKTTKESTLMREKENFYISLYFSNTLNVSRETLSK